MESKKATIYTATGDNGTTSLIGGTRVAKNHPRVEAYGTLDELNAHLGLLAASIHNTKIVAFIEEIENNILTIGCGLACKDAGNIRTIPVEKISILEKEIDLLEASLPPMHDFILPSSDEAPARANLCRTVCRRAERTMVAVKEHSEVPQESMVYINRLSDYLFLLQRFLHNGKEKKWEKPCK
ncbi:MAG: cob(I)yrinic acid a,c-diamide adenosyltransferase [Bacteroidaceae bacterium]|nr:cob(I)yrinic acid a,c-diamide adenosyltransferase [Bacteroidaceae bacterium]